MSLLDKASLVQIPSGYKEDKLYSVVPDSGAGDFTFSRSSTGTRVNADGYIEDAPWNLLNYSEDLTGANGWRQDLGLTTQLTTEINPIGVNSCYKTIADTNTNTHYTYSTNAIGNLSYFGGFCVSFYAKPNGYNWIRYYNNNNAFGVDINIVTGEIQNKREDSIGTILVEDAQNGWKKVSLQFDRLISYSYAMLKPMPTALGNSTFAGDGVSGMFLWGIQISKGLNFKPYIKRTDGFDVPRLDYSGGASCPTLLLEPQSTNLVTQSETFSNWGTEGGKQVVTQGVLISPDGTLNGNKLETYNSTNSNPRKLWIAKTVTVGASYTFSVYIKQVSGQINSGFLHITTGANDTFDVSQAYTATDQWQRVSVTTNSAVSSQIRFLITGDANSQIYIWGGQVEQQSYPTSYIPTSGTSITRVEDLCVATSMTDLIGQTEGVVNLKFQKEYTDTYRIFSLFGTSTSNRIGLYTLNDTLRVFSISGGVSQFDTTVLSSIGNGTFNIALQYKLDDYKVYVNGNEVYTNTTAAIPASLEDILFAQTPTGGSPFYHKIDYLRLFKETLTDTELAALTTI